MWYYHITNVATFKLIPLGFSLSIPTNILCKSVGLATIFPLFPTDSRIVLVVPVDISLLELALAFPLLITKGGVMSSTLAWLFELFTVLDGDTGEQDCSGGDGSGEDDGLPLAAVVDDITDL